MNGIKGVSPILWGGLIVVATSAVVVLYLQSYHKPVTQDEMVTDVSATPVTTVTLTETATPAATSEPTPLAEPGVTWLDEPKKLENLQLLTFDPKHFTDGRAATYYKVGTYSGEDIILALFEGDGIYFYPDNLLYIKNAGKDT